jgi:hypothetical protein
MSIITSLNEHIKVLFSPSILAHSVNLLVNLLIIKGNKCYVEDIPKEHKLTQILQIGE